MQLIVCIVPILLYIPYSTLYTLIPLNILYPTLYTRFYLTPPPPKPMQF